MQFIIYTLLLALLSSGNVGVSKLPDRFCKYLRLSQSGHLSAVEVCKAGGGSICHDNITMPEAVCEASQISFCDGRTMPQVICQAMGSQVCANTTTLMDGLCRGEGHMNCDLVSAKKKASLLEQYEECLNPPRVLVVPMGTGSSVDKNKANQTED